MPIHSCAWLPLVLYQLGNEQYNDQFVEQVAAIEARAKKIGISAELQYIFPQNMGMNATDSARAEALGLGDRLLTDIHDGSGGGVRIAEKVFAVRGRGGSGVIV